MQPSSAEQYIADVLAGKILTSKLVRLQLERHQQDLIDGPARGLRFNRIKAGAVIEFFHSFILQTDDTQAGQPFKLLPFQQALLWIYYGWEWADTGFRRYKTAYIEVSRGNGKSGLLSGLGLFDLLTGPPGSEVYAAATDRDTARVIFDTSADMVRMSPILSKRIKKYRDNLHIPSRGSKFEPLSSKDDNLQGKRPTMVLIDELHVHPTAGVWTVLVNALGKRDNSRLIAITTAGYDRNSVCWQQREYTQKVLTGVIPDDSWFGWIATLDEEDLEKWDDEALWIKSNPALGSLVKIADMREQALKAKSDPASLNSFLRYRLNVWTTNESVWMPMDKWDACSEPVNASKLKGRSCFAGLDLSTTTDISALVLVFPPDGSDSKWRILPHFFLPADSIQKRAKKDRVPYDVWERQGLFTLTQGNVIDYDVIRTRINELAEQYQIVEVAYDPYNATQIVSQLTSDGLTMVPIRQGDVSMTAPCKRLMELVLTGDLAHGGNPVLRWMANNVVVAVGATGLIKPDKARSREKIDGISATLNALARAMVKEIPRGFLAQVW